MRKGNKVIFNGELYEVIEKRGQHVIIYNPRAKFPELTKHAIPIKHVVLATTARK